MIVGDARLIKARRLARIEPRLCFVRVPIEKLLEEVRRDYLPQVHHRLELYFVRRGPLACICHDETTGTVYVHEVLNLSETPAEVILAICKHELLHMVIPGRAVKGRVTSHPPEFWARERELAPERDVAWEWVWTNAGDCLRRRPRLERIDVISRWRAKRRLKMTAREHLAWVESRRRPSLEDSGW